MTDMPVLAILISLPGVWFHRAFLKTSQQQKINNIKGYQNTGWSTHLVSTALLIKDQTFSGCEDLHLPWTWLGVAEAKHHSGSASLAHLPVSSAAVLLLWRISLFPAPFLMTIEQDLRCVLGAHLSCLISPPFPLALGMPWAAVSCTTTSFSTQIQRQHYSAETSRQLEESEQYILQAVCTNRVLSADNIFHNWNICLMAVKQFLMILKSLLSENVSVILRVFEIIFS